MSATMLSIPLINSIVVPIADHNWNSADILIAFLPRRDSVDVLFHHVIADVLSHNNCMVGNGGNLSG